MSNGMTTDLTITNHGSICILYPHTPLGNVWIDDNLPEDAQRWGSGVVIEPRYVDPILDGAINDGLTVA